jgi:hypothetical protein
MYFIFNIIYKWEEPSWPWSYGSWIYNYLCIQYLSPLILLVRISIRARCTTLCDKVCHVIYGSWIYNYLCNQCLSPLMLWVRSPFMPRCTRFCIMWSSLSVTCDRSVVFSGFLWLENTGTSTGIVPISRSLFHMPDRELSRKKTLIEFSFGTFKLFLYHQNVKCVVHSEFIEIKIYYRDDSRGSPRILQPEETRENHRPVASHWQT